MAASKALGKPPREIADALVPVLQDALGADAEQVTEALRKQGIGPRLAQQAIELVPPWQTYSVFSIVDALTRIAGRYENAGDRLLLDQKAASLLSLAA